MEETIAYINSCPQIKNILYVIGSDTDDAFFVRIRTVLRMSVAGTIFFTGVIDQTKKKSMLSLIDEERKNNKVTAEICFCDKQVDFSKRDDEDVAVFFDGINDYIEIVPYVSVKPRWLIGRMQETAGSTAFRVWETYRKTCEHIFIKTVRGWAEPQILSWDRRENSSIELSVIFPVYNVGKYLEQCLESVTAWKADYVEYLFVNDGSPDNSKEIIEKWAEKDSRVQLLNKPNGGCASARQYGLERARGNYVGFIDPDDWIDESMFRKLLRAAMVGSYEISYCGYNKYYEDSGVTVKEEDDLDWPLVAGIHDKRKINELIAYCRVAIWRGIYKMDMLRRANIHFYTEIRRFDDLPFKVETFAAAKSVVTVNEHLYYYRLARPGQDMAADDERLYVHFPIFTHLNESIASQKDARLTDWLQMCKIQTHRFALEKIQEQYVEEYLNRAKQDLLSTGVPWRTALIARERLGRRAALYAKMMMSGNKSGIMWLRKSAQRQHSTVLNHKKT